MDNLRKNLSTVFSWAFSAARVQFRGARAAVSRNTDLDSLIAEHFAVIGEPEHPSRPTLDAALRHIADRPARIFETGTAA